MGKTTAWQEEAERQPREKKSAIVDPIPVALDFLCACRDERRPLALITGVAGTGKSMLIHRLLREIDDVPVAHLKTPTADPHVFLQSLLAQFGFDAFESTSSDLSRLADVFMRHESRKEMRPVVIIEDVQDYGPEVWKTIRELAFPDPEEKATSLFVLTGHPQFASESIAPAFDSVYSLDVTVRAAALSDGPDCPTLEVWFRDRPYGLHRLTQPKITIGRNGANDVRISGVFVSRFHAVLTVEDDGIHLIDLQSTNGTHVNGERVKRRRLRNGDIIQIEEFRLNYAEPVEAADEPADAGDVEELVMQAPLDHLLDQSA